MIKVKDIYLDSVTNEIYISFQDIISDLYTSFLKRIKTKTRFKEALLWEIMLALIYAMFEYKEIDINRPFISCLQVNLFI